MGNSTLRLEGSIRYRATMNAEPPVLPDATMGVAGVIRNGDAVGLSQPVEAAEV